MDRFVQAVFPAKEFNFFCRNHFALALKFRDLIAEEVAGRKLDNNENKNADNHQRTNHRQ